MVLRQVAPRAILALTNVAQGATAIESYSCHGAANRLSCWHDSVSILEACSLPYRQPM
jgi:hypothetical protein